MYLESEWDRSGRERKPSEGKFIFILQLLKDTLTQANYRLLCGPIWTWAFQLPAEDVRTSERYYGLISSRNRETHQLAWDKAGYNFKATTPSGKVSGWVHSAIPFYDSNRIDLFILTSGKGSSAVQTECRTVTWSIPNPLPLIWK